VIRGGTVVAHFMHKAASRLAVFLKGGAERHDIELPALGSVVGVSGEWDGTELYFGFQSFSIPPTVYRMDLAAMGKPTLWAQVKTDVDFTQFTVEQVTYPSKDGTPITMFLTAKKGVKRDGKAPTLLYGYGGFNVSLTPTFAASRFPFLERGGVLAIANL